MVKRLRRFSIECLEKRTLLTAELSGFAEETFVSGLNRPTAMEFAPDGRLFVAEQDGDLRVIKNGALKSTPVLTVSVDSKVERGLIGLVLDPNFSSNNYLYIYWTTTTPTTHNRVSRFTINGDVADPNSRKDILDLPSLDPAHQNHNGGAMHFGPDGKLYVAVGENGNPTQAQDLSNPFGKILRVNSDGTIPQDGPFYDSTTGIARAIYAYGLRNTFTFDFQEDTGRFFANDVGQNEWEEVNDIKRGGNYGWPLHEGPSTASGFESPVYSYSHDDYGSTAIVGAAFYDHQDNHTAPFPASYDNNYFYGAIHGDVYVADLDNPGEEPVRFARKVPYPVDLDMGPDGSLFLLARVTGYSPGEGTARVLRYSFTGTDRPSIGLQPANETSSVGGDATFNISASGPALSYQWQRDGVDIAGATSNSYTIEDVAVTDNGAKFRVVVSNSAGSVTSNAATLTVVSNKAPVPVITTPVTGLHFIAGQPIDYTGTATDVEDGTIDPASYVWNISYFRGGFDTPFLPDTEQAGGTFTPATVSPYLLTEVFYRIRLTVTDSEGLSGTTSVDVVPTTTTLTVSSNIPGLTLALDGVPVTAPYSVEAVAGMARPISAPPTQELNGVTYDFLGWSDGGAAAHTLLVPVAPTEFVATYQARVIEPPPGPGTDPGVDPGTDPGTAPGTDPGTEPPVDAPPLPTIGPDLAIAMLKAKAADVVVGAQGSVHLRVTNRGVTSFAGPVQLKLFLSADTTADDSDMLAVTLDKALNLRAGRQLAQAVKFIYPEIPADGDYYLVARVVPMGNAPRETVITNNVTVAPVACHVERAHLELSPAALMTRPSVAAGGSLAVSLGLLNEGNVPLNGSLGYDILVRREEEPESAAVKVATALKTIHVKSGRQLRITKRITLPADLPPGMYVVSVVIDTGGAFAEQNELNNTLVGPMFTLI
jgi:glucose/arabinose dehydrogenase